ncbi:putative lipoprotein [Stutzerimonas stutzeri TS44]|nr:putative lipoprotein [Stutzerimonas stutzeri TS44]
MARTFARLTLCLLALGLSACQHDNPYTDAATPIPDAPPASAATPDRSVYPAAPLEFSRYRTWSWRTPPAGTGSLAPEELQEIVASALDQRGLRPAPPDGPADLRITTSVRSETRLRQVYDDYGGYYGHGRYDSDYGMWGRAPLVRTYEERVLVVYLELFDPQRAAVVWSNQAQARQGGERSQLRDALRDAVDRALADYPPS